MILSANNTYVLSREEEIECNAFTKVKDLIVQSEEVTVFGVKALCVIESVEPLCGLTLGWSAD